MKPPLTPLGYALLGLICAQPRTGYGLRMVFETTPLGRYSSSPGSIYPALKALQKAGLIDGQKAGLRKQVFHLTPKGQTTLSAWLHLPVTADEFSRQLDIALLRFALLQHVAERDVTLAFLNSFIVAGETQVQGLKTFLASDDAKSLPQHGRLAVGHGLASTEASVAWARSAYLILTTGEDIQ